MGGRICILQSSHRPEGDNPMNRSSSRVERDSRGIEAVCSFWRLGTKLAGLALICSTGGMLLAEPPAAVAPAPVADAKPYELPKYPAPADVRAAFLKQLDRPKVEPDVKQLSPPRSENGLTTEHLSIATEKKVDGTYERVPMLIVRPEKAAGRLP